MHLNGFYVVLKVKGSASPLILLGIFYSLIWAQPRLKTGTTPFEISQRFVHQMEGHEL